MNRIFNLLLGISLLLFPVYTFATHAVGIDLTYQCNGGNQYSFTLTLYRDCAGVSAPTAPSVNVSSASCGINTSAALSLVSVKEVSQICPSQLGSTTCNGGSLPGIEEYIYTGTHTFPMVCTDWVLGYSLCCRNNAVTNLSSPGSQNIYVEALLNNSVCNSSPVFTTLPVPYICAGTDFSYNHGVIDIDGDGSLNMTIHGPRSIKL